ncbi:hypothetical protein BDK51DRAFT_52594 [Blyttiomyces helicus]|uniref:Uncharacterized protein n=1 Tax=Blyttiomyces helicus TaxID=388810 RepID=A0A4P9WEL9_9FUNG|nr:hypothetical protein BDK51DRAFT_52594 [Blyttiomyces helicus]|eukprot:RKO90842.1 hypothetical protein BDK51DRAFT_52594 [Blyttiomyces helicus]
MSPLLKAPGQIELQAHPIPTMQATVEGALRHRPTACPCRFLHESPDRGLHNSLIPERAGGSHLAPRMSAVHVPSIHWGIESSMPRPMYSTPGLPLRHWRECRDDRGPLPSVASRLPSLKTLPSHPSTASGGQHLNNATSSPLATGLNPEPPPSAVTQPTSNVDAIAAAKQKVVLAMNATRQLAYASLAMLAEAEDALKQFMDLVSAENKVEEEGLEGLEVDGVLKQEGTG